MKITVERPSDASAIRRVTEMAFRRAQHSNGTEAGIVEALRAAGALSVSLVAIEADDVVGHAAFSPVSIHGAAGGWYGLGPVSVTPELQRRGIGQALIREGLARLKSMGAHGCVVLGDPAYYGRFGFANDPDLYYGDVKQGYFQRLVFFGASPKGEVRYQPGFDAAE